MVTDIIEVALNNFFLVQEKVDSFLIFVKELLVRFDFSIELGVIFLGYYTNCIKTDAGRKRKIDRKTFG